MLDLLVRRGAEVSVLCFAHGEASTLHGGRAGELFEIRQAELAAAASALGVRHTRLLSYPDGALASVALSELVTQVRTTAAELNPSCLVAFDKSGVTGHPDHAHATAAAVTAGTLLGLPVFGWTVPDGVARALNAEFGTAFAGRPAEEIDWIVPVDRDRQWRAIAAHVSQSADNPVLRERLRLLGDSEHLLVLVRRRPPGTKVRAFRADQQSPTSAATADSG